MTWLRLSYSRLVLFYNYGLRLSHSRQGLCPVGILFPIPLLSFPYRFPIILLSFPYRFRIISVSFSYRSPIVLLSSSYRDTETIRKRSGECMSCKGRRVKNAGKNRGGMFFLPLPQISRGNASRSLLLAPLLSLPCEILSWCCGEKTFRCLGI